MSFSRCTGTVIRRGHSGRKHILWLTTCPYAIDKQCCIHFNERRLACVCVCRECVRPAYVSFRFMLLYEKIDFCLIKCIPHFVFFTSFFLFSAMMMVCGAIFYLYNTGVCYTYRCRYWFEYNNKIVS